MLDSQRLDAKNGLHLHARSFFTSGDLSLSLVRQMIRFTFEECLFSIGALDFGKRYSFKRMSAFGKNFNSRTKIQVLCKCQLVIGVSLPLVMKTLTRWDPPAEDLEPE